MTFNKFTAHPWHGISIHQDSPNAVNAFIEILPTDVIKYEVDKQSGHLKVDRPQSFSNICPTLYGFVPQTYCGALVAQFANVTKGDQDPLDICVFSERPITHSNILMEARPIGGLRLIDKGEADDKILAVLKNDSVYSSWTDIMHIPEPLINRLQHYFLTYKNQATGTNQAAVCRIDKIYDAKTAKEVISRSQKDYENLVKNS
ncbi:MAG: inorganic pyrophosphatase [Proteobacteria bacterium]|nr:inorganic pyrophosphatase [Pseudomonadota bacterium]